MKKIMLTLVVSLLIVSIYGVYMFGFASADIPAEDVKGNTVQIDKKKRNNFSQNSCITELKTKTGKIIIVSESHPFGQSISSISIKTKGFKENKLIQLKHTDPVEKIELADLDNNGFEELYIFTRSVGSGSCADFYVYASERDERLINCEKEKLEEKDYLEGVKVDGYMGNAVFGIEKNLLVMQFTIYKKNDKNNKPTGGFKKIHYKLNKMKLIKIR